MSLAYDEYLNAHIEAVQKGWNWMIDNLIDRIHPWIREQYPNSEFDPIDILGIGEQIMDHDRSKIRPEEYYAYDAYFYGGNKSHAVVENFRKAFLLHIHENPHHWQYWVLIHDDPDKPETLIEIPLNYIFEMICDWWSFSWRKGDLMEIFDWWDKHKDYIRMHKKSRKILEYILKEMKDILTEEKEDDHLEHHGILGQRWGKKNGPPYPLNTAKVAQKIFERASQKSKTITRSVEDASNSAGGELHGLEHRLKTVDSIERKINKKVDEKDMSVSDAAASIKDALRYTVIAPTDNFVEMYKGFKDSMAQQGYVETSCDNYFDKFNKGEVKHKAIQSNFADTDGYEFEVQFHTPESQDAKDKKLPLYEERRSSGVSERRKRELEKQMEDLALNVPDPEGIEYILSHGIIENNFLSHHGIKGQKWGVRRFQNEDGTRTNKGKEREYYRRRVIRELKNIDDVNRIVSTLSDVEQRELGLSSGDDKWIPDEKRIDQASNIAKTFLEYDGDIPISMLEIWDIGDGRADIALATDPKYRGTGATSRNIKNAIKWFNSKENTKFNELQWNNLKENPKSGEIADHYGFGDYVDDDKWEYRRIFKNEGKIAHTDIPEEEEDKNKFGLPDLKKYPMPDPDHVKSAIRFFNYVDPKHEKELAEAILERMKEYDMSFEDFGVGDENRFKNYIPKTNQKDPKDQESK